MKLTQYISLLLLTGAAASVVSCTEMDDYLRFTEGVSSTYTGKLDSAVFLAGNGRLLFHGELSSDPKVSRIGLYWNVGTKQDSLSIEVDYAKDKIVEQEIALGEGSYNFQIYTYDSAGNHSIPMTRSGNSYGANYLEGLYNRVVKSCALDGEDIAIEWYSGSENSPYTVVTYTGADGKPVEVQVGPKEEQTRLPQVRENQFKVQSVYLPEENAIDLFRPEAKLYFVSDITSLYLKNAGPNIQGAEKPDGSPWGVPKDWNITPNLRNQVNNTVGGWKDEQYEQYKGLIHFESQDWGGPGFENGKVWQTPTLQPGTYEFTVFYLRGNTADDQYIHLAAALGSELPDRADMEKRALAWKHLLPSDQGRENSIRFTVTQAGPVSLGLVVTISRDSQYLQFPYFKLSQIPEEE